MRENLQSICIALLLALFIRTFIVQPFKIPSGSMLPTLQIGDHILVCKFRYNVKVPLTRITLFEFSTPQVNDIIVFRYPVDPTLDYIKRIIAVEGDIIEIRNKQIYVNKKPFVDLHGSFTDEEIHKAVNSCRENFGPMCRDNLGPLIVPKDSFFVMGDNRDNSLDGRFWGFVKRDAVRGKAWRIYWSWDLRKPFFSKERFLSIRWKRIGRKVDRASEQ